MDCTTTAVAVGSFGPCTIDDKLFVGFGATVGTDDVSQFLTVRSVEDGDLLRETLEFGLPATLPVGVSATVPLTIFYSVTALDPAFLITDVHLGLSADIFGLVTETITFNNTTIATLFAGTDPLSGFLGLTDEAIFEGVNTIAVVKALTALGINQSGTISQAVTQERVVPEPAGIVLLGFALAGFAARQRQLSRLRRE